MSQSSRLQFAGPWKKPVLGGSWQEDVPCHRAGAQRGACSCRDAVTCVTSRAQSQSLSTASRVSLEKTGVAAKPEEASLGLEGARVRAERLAEGMVPSRPGELGTRS